MLLTKEKRMGFAERDGFGHSGFHPITAVKFGRPVSTENNVGNWVAFGAATLYEATDEEVANDDTDYIQVTGNNKQCILGLSAITDPVVHTGHILRIRTKKLAAAIRLYIDIYQDGALLFHVGVIAFADPPGSWQTNIVITFTEAQAALITNYSTLSIRLASNNFNPTNKGNVTWIELEVP